MGRQNRSAWILLALLGLTALACGPSPTSPASPVPPTATAEPQSTTVPPTAAAVCPPAGQPPVPLRPESLGEYSQALADYLSAGASPEALEQMLRNWGGLGHGDAPVRSEDLTGDGVSEIIVVLMDPWVPSAFPPGDILIFGCQDSSVTPVLSVEERSGFPEFGYNLLEVRDINGNALVDMAYSSVTCGAHTCYEWLFIVEWDGRTFVNRIPDVGETPYPTFEFGDGQVLIHTSGVGSVGAGLQRDYHETWTWNGEVFALTESYHGPPVARIHYLYDGDEALLAGDFSTAIENYGQVLKATEMPTGLLGEENEAVLVTFARFKLLVAYAAAGDDAKAADTHLRLLICAPPGLPEHVYTQMAEAFLGDYEMGKGVQAACDAAIAFAKDHPEAVDLLYAGYVNTLYNSPANLCRVP